MTETLWTCVSGRGVSSGQTLVNAHPLIKFIFLADDSSQPQGPMCILSGCFFVFMYLFCFKE